MRCGFISLGRVLTRAIVRHVPSSQCIFTSRLPGTTEREHKKSWLKAEYNIESLRRGYVERVCVWLILNGIGLVVSYTGEKKRNIGSVSSVCIIWILHVGERVHGGKRVLLETVQDLFGFFHVVMIGGSEPADLLWGHCGGLALLLIDNWARE
jgi:hypothetical protein